MRRHVERLNSSTRYGSPPSLPSRPGCFSTISSTVSTTKETGIKIAYCRPELYAHLYILEGCTAENTFETSVTVGLTKDGDVKVFSENVEESV